MPELQRDNWGKFDIISKFLSGVVLVAIPIVIGYSANNISQSIQKGQLVQTLIEQLVQTDAKGDIALITLNESLPYKKVECTVTEQTDETVTKQTDECDKALKHDRVFRIANIVTDRQLKDIRKFIQEQKQKNENGVLSDNDNKIVKEQINNLKIVEEIIDDKTFSGYWKWRYKPQLDEIQALAGGQQLSNQNPNHQPTKQEINLKANISEILSVIQPPTTIPNNLRLNGIKIVYIQYRSNRTKAEQLQTALQQENISAPGIEQVQGISKNDIRYANKADLKLAQNLRYFLKNKTDIQIENKDLIDLSTKGYRVPSGQLEIWLKD